MSSKIGLIRIHILHKRPVGLEYLQSCFPNTFMTIGFYYV